MFHQLPAIRPQPRYQLSGGLTCLIYFRSYVDSNFRGSWLCRYADYAPPVPCISYTYLFIFLIQYSRHTRHISMFSNLATEFEAKFESRSRADSVSSYAEFRTTIDRYSYWETYLGLQPRSRCPKLPHFYPLPPPGKMLDS